MPPGIMIVTFRGYSFAKHLGRIGIHGASAPLNSTCFVLHDLLPCDPDNRDCLLQ